jgi:hypothetical protein
MTSRKSVVRLTAWALRRIHPSFGSPLEDWRQAGQLFLNDESVRDVFLLRSTRGIDVVLRILDRPVPAMLQSALMGWLQQTQSVADRSTLAYRLLVLDGLAASGTARSSVGLSSAQQVIRVYSLTQLNQLWKVATAVASQPVDPYSSRLVAAGARAFLVSLYASRPDFDPKLIEAIPTLVQNAGSVTLELFAVGSRGRPTQVSQAVASVAEAFRLKGGELERFLAAASPPPRLGYSEKIPPSIRITRRFFSGASRQLGRVVAYLAGPAIGLALLALPKSTVKAWSVVPPGLSEALAMLALLVTAHVLVVELSAGRLPGPVSRLAASPPSLVGAYSVSLTLVVVCSAKSEPTGQGLDLIRTALLGALILLLARAVWSILQNTSPQEAAQIFASASTWRMLKAGRIFGQRQGAVLTWKVELLGIPNLSVLADTFVGETGRLLRADAPGYVYLDVDRIRSLAERLDSLGGSYLAVLDSPGRRVSAGQPLGFIHARPDSAVDARALRELARGLSVHNLPSADRSIADFAALLTLILQALESGDRYTAEEIGHRLVNLLRIQHSEAARSRVAYIQKRARLAPDHSRGVAWAIDASRYTHLLRERELAPALPALLNTTRHCVSAWYSADAPAGESLLQLLDHLLSIGGPSDNIAASVLQLADAAPTKSKGTALLEKAAIQALDLEMVELWALLIDKVETVLEAEQDELVDRLATLTSRACWMSRPCSDYGWQKIERSASECSAPTRIRAYLRVGASSVAATQLDLSSLVARRAHLDGLLDTLTQTASALSEIELARSQFSGNYLGMSSGQSISQFCNFASKLRDSGAI